MLLPQLIVERNGKGIKMFLRRQTNVKFPVLSES